MGVTCDTGTILKLENVVLSYLVDVKEITITSRQNVLA